MHVQPAVQPGWNVSGPDVSGWNVYGAPRPDPAKDLRDESNAAKWASRAMTIGAVLYVFYYVGFVLLMGWIVDRLSGFHSGSEQEQQEQFQHFAGEFFGSFALLEVIAVGLFAVQVVIIVWFYRAALVASRLSIPARRAPIWAAIGFVIPVVNFWFPYQAALDMLPAGHAGRRLVGWWWAGWLSQSLLWFLPMGAAILSVPVGISLSLLVSIVPILTARTGRQLVAEVGVAHRGLLSG